VQTELHLKNQKYELRNDWTYLQSQSNNMVFSNISEAPTESAETTESVLSEFLVERNEMKIAQDLVNQISFERVHRMHIKRKGQVRNIVAKFTM
jgi:hypothetical protein